MQLFEKSHNKLNPINLKVKIQNDKDENMQQMETQLHKISKSFLIISQLFISSPMGIHKPRSNIQKKDKILHVIWCLSIYAFLAFCTYHEYIYMNIILPTIRKPLYFSEYFVYLIHLLELIRMINFRGQMFWKFKMFILDFDRTLLEMKVGINYGDLWRFLCQHMALIVLHFVFTVIIGYFYNEGKILNFLRSNTIYILPNVIIHISLVQYYALLFIVYKRGEKLYVLLEKLLNTSSSSNDIWNFRHQLHLFRSLFAKLEEFTKSVNDHYSISILLVYFGSFINLSLNVFLLYKFLSAYGSSDPVWSIYSLAWAFMHIGKMFLILYYNQNIQNMKSKTTRLLSSCKFEHQTIETTIRLVILQLMSDTRSNFLCGIVALNMKFITSLLVAISTLVIFLIQYDITYEALTKTHNSVGTNTIIIN